MTALIIGLVTAFNFIIIMIKFKAGRTEDGFLDLVLLGIIVSLTSGSLQGMQIGMIASAVISLYLFFAKKSLFRALVG